MTEQEISARLNDLEATVNLFAAESSRQTLVVRGEVRGMVYQARDLTRMQLSVIELKLVRSVSLVYIDAEFHLLRAYYHSSPGIIAIIKGIIEFATAVIAAINTINEIAKIITGENLAYWVDKIIPGFKEAWENVMNAISEVSGALGWAAGGLGNLMNVGQSLNTTRGMFGGKSDAWFDEQKINNTRFFARQIQANADKWKDNPGAQLENYLQIWSGHAWSDGATQFKLFSGKVDGALTKIEDVGKVVGGVTDDLLEIREGMPEFVAKNIPQGIWDFLEGTDTFINDRLLPALDDIQTRLDEVDSFMDKLSARQGELAERLKRPGDLLAEIDSLEGFVRTEQLVKIDGVVSEGLGLSNQAEYNEIAPVLDQWGKISSALNAPTPPLPFLTLEQGERGAVPGIVAEPRETWFVGDY